VKKKRLKRELRALSDSYARLQETHRRLVAHTEVIAVAVRSPDLVPQSDLDDAIAGIHELNGESTLARSSSARRPAAPV
jgi:hypothetical protein